MAVLSYRLGRSSMAEKTSGGYYLLVGLLFDNYYKSSPFNNYKIFIISQPVHNTYRDHVSCIVCPALLNLPNFYWILKSIVEAFQQKILFYHSVLPKTSLLPSGASRPDFIPEHHLYCQPKLALFPVCFRPFSQLKIDSKSPLIKSGLYYLRRLQQH